MKAWLKSIIAPLAAVGKTLHLKKTKNQGTDVLCAVPAVVIGGAEKVVWDIVQGLSGRQYRFHLLAQRGERNPWCEGFIKSFENAVLFDGPKEQDRFYKEVLERMIRELNIKIILISNAQKIYPLCAWIKRQFPSIKIIDLVHAQSPRYLQGDILSAVPYLDQRICVCQDVKDFLMESSKQAKLNGAQINRISFIYNGNDTGKFRKRSSLDNVFKFRHQIDPKARIVSFIGRFSPEKRPLLFLDIACRTLKECSDGNIVFVMAGDGQQMPEIKNRIQDKRLSRHLRLTGMIDANEVVELLNDTYVLLITSASEGFPLILLEAMSMDVPAIAMQVGGVGEIVVDGVNGIVVPNTENAVEKVSSLLGRLLNSPVQRDALAGKCRGWISEKFSLENTIKEYAHVFESLCP